MVIDQISTSSNNFQRTYMYNDAFSPIAYTFNPHKTRSLRRNVAMADGSLFGVSRQSLAANAVAQSDGNFKNEWIFRNTLGFTPIEIGRSQLSVNPIVLPRTDTHNKKWFIPVIINSIQNAKRISVPNIQARSHLIKK